MRQSIYIETSIVSYLVARPSRDLVAAARQQRTHEWWNVHRSAFSVWASELVLEEATRGDPDAARLRLDALAAMQLLPLTADVDRVSAALLKGAALPDQAVADAVHIAIATVHRVDYLLTWNCKHIANPFIQRAVQRVTSEEGFVAPVVCTPEAFVGG